MTKDTFTPNYKNYTFDELEDAYSHINKELYPERVKLLEEEIKIRKTNGKIIPAKQEEQSELKRFLSIALSDGLEKESPSFESIETAINSLDLSNDGYAILKINNFTYVKTLKGFNGRYSLVYQDSSDEIFISKLKVLSKDFVLKFFKEYAKANSNWKTMIEWEELPKGYLSQSSILNKIWNVIKYALLALMMSIRLYSKSISKYLVQFPINYGKIFVVFMSILIYLSRKEIINFGKICNAEKRNTIFLILAFLFSVYAAIIFDF